MQDKANMQDEINGQNGMSAQGEADIQEKMNMQDENGTRDRISARSELSTQDKREAARQKKDRHKHQKGRESSDGIISSMLAKIVAFFLLCIGVLIAFVGGVATGYIESNSGYQGNDSEFIRQLMTEQVWEDYRELKAYYENADYDYMERFLENTNLNLEIYAGNDQDGMYHNKIWGDYQGEQMPYSYNIYTYIQDGDQELPLDFKFFVDPSFAIQDGYKQAYEIGSLILKYRYAFPVILAVSLLLALCSFLFLMCSAGHHRGREGVSKGILTIFPFDLVTIIFGVIAFLMLIFLAEACSSLFKNLIVVIVTLCVLLAEVIWCTIYCMEFAVELKLGILFQNTVLRKIIAWFVRLLGKIWRGFVQLCKGLPIVWRVLIAYGIVSFIEFCALLIFSGEAELAAFWFCEKIILLFLIIYVSLMWKKLEWAGEALAEGDMDYRVDTSGMVFTFKKQGESLNRIGEGITLAVEDRMKSEHLKTELITNVSHDLKTPLTSIINYADLLGTLPEQEDIDREKLEEYAEVLLRQSKRLKKLLEDLIEASKATTGNLEVNLTPIEVGVLLSQTVGEYEQKLQEKQMQLMIRQPEEPVVIQADGRHLWRIFDNLFNNIYKYGQENTRVYLTVEKGESEVLISFKNISKYPLEISGEELQERFVRGDKSRHMEGNGLGLSIAGSLAELQGGSVEIVTDGDLFKVVLHFPN